VVLEAGADGIEVVLDAADVGILNVVVQQADQGSGDHEPGAVQTQVPSRWGTAAMAATTLNGPRRPTVRSRKVIKAVMAVIVRPAISSQQWQ
jgi:hypothetical protein